MNVSHEDEQDTLLPDPRAALPSPVEGMSLAEYESIAANIRFFGRLTLSQQLRAIAQDTLSLVKSLRLGRRYT